LKHQCRKITQTGQQEYSGYDYLPGIDARCFWVRLRIAIPITTQKPTKISLVIMLIGQTDAPLF
jgi:hypothetical protein